MADTESDLAAQVAKQAAKRALKGVFGGDDDEVAQKPSWKKKGLAGIVGSMAAFYLLNKVIPIVPGLSIADWLLAFGVLGWSAHVWGVRPLALLRRRKEKKQLEAGDP